MILLLVESPTKARTLKGFLGKNYQVLASFGHVRDLPKGEFGVDTENNFEPKYVIPTKARKVVSGLKKESAKAKEIILASDEDREGESISWHLKETLNLKDPKRIVFHEITKEAIKEALDNPRKIDMNLVNSQQARRILDRIVGYKLSPFLWKKVSKGLSAGRVQSVAVRLVVEREEEIKKFVPTEHWSIEVLLKKIEKQKTSVSNSIELDTELEGQFSALLIKKDRKVIDKLETKALIRKNADGARPSAKNDFSALVKNKKEADEILKNLGDADYKVEKIERKETKRNPLPPFTTSTLQQSSANKFGYSAKMTMSLAQQLYERGFITYHRTDSLNLSNMSIDAARKFIVKTHGQNYYQFRQFKAKGKVQEAHEAIRPTRAEHTPEYLRSELDGSQLKLYGLIWQRFIASQMSSAVFDSTSIEITAQHLTSKTQRSVYTFGANGQTLKFSGFLKVYPIKFSETDLPPLKEKEILDLVKIVPLQHFTEPPARYNEASLIKALEHHGIGRPSTYAPTLSTIQARSYITKNDQKRFYPTEMGNIVNDVLVKNFPQIVDIDFTAKMEKELDEIEDGKDTWQKTCRDFYIPFAKNLKEKFEAVKKQNTDIKTDKLCPKCGKSMVEKLGRFGRFYACAGFPECKHTESLVKIEGSAKPITLDITCPKCNMRIAQPSSNGSGYANAPMGVGQIVAKKTKRGKIFYGCNQYPNCDMATWDKPINEFCPQCHSILVETKSQKIKCSNKDCDYKKD